LIAVQKFLIGVTVKLLAHSTNVVPTLLTKLAIPLLLSTILETFSHSVTTFTTFVALLTALDAVVTVLAASVNLTQAFANAGAFVASDNPFVPTTAATTSSTQDHKSRNASGHHWLSISLSPYFSCVLVFNLEIPES
jgi:hypothetical protein